MFAVCVALSIRAPHSCVLIRQEDTFINSITIDQNRTAVAYLKHTIENIFADMHAMNTVFFVFFHRRLFFALRHNHTRRDYNKRSRTKNALAKMCRAKQRCAPVERTCVRNQPLILGSIFFFLKKGKSTANTTIYSMSRVSMARIQLHFRPSRSQFESCLDLEL